MSPTISSILISIPNRFCKATMSLTTVSELSSGRLPYSLVSGPRSSAWSSMSSVTTTTALTSSKIACEISGKRVIWLLLIGCADPAACDLHQTPGEAGELVAKERPVELAVRRSGQDATDHHLGGHHVAG